jgi:hypothetical protein
MRLLERRRHISAFDLLTQQFKNIVAMRRRLDYRIQIDGGSLRQVCSREVPFDNCGH